MKLKRTSRLLLLFIVMIAMGCAGRIPRLQVSLGMPQAEQEVAAASPDAEAPSSLSPRPSKGSLWPGQTSHNMFFADNKAHTINDIVTIEIVESSTASKQATTKLGRSSELSATATGLFGLETKLNSRLGRVQTSNAAGTSKAAALDLANILKTSTQNDFDGSGVTTRSGQLSGKMTALVKSVLPNSNLKIEGKRVVTVNGEEQVMVLAGIIRPEDIDSNNVVLSTYIAEAKISYFGMGVVGDKQKPGWMTRIFDKVWPF